MKQVQIVCVSEDLQLRSIGRDPKTETVRDMATYGMHRRTSRYCTMGFSRWTVLPTRTLKEGRPDRDEH
jgi:hypothetical protein